MMEDISKEIEKKLERYAQIPFTSKMMGRVESDVRGVLDHFIDIGDLKPINEDYNVCVSYDKNDPGRSLHVNIIEKQEPIITYPKEKPKPYDYASWMFDVNGDFVKYLASHKLTDGEIRHIENKIRNAARGKDCIDNYRFYCESGMVRLHRTINEKAEYIEHKASGCCGFYDEKINLRSGKTFVFGFNYGH